jgi:hypothetical protein
MTVKWIEVVQPTDGVLSGRHHRDRRGETQAKTTARCNCLVDHPGHRDEPKEAIWGCGRHGTIDAPR